MALVSSITLGPEPATCTPGMAAAASRTRRTVCLPAGVLEAGEPLVGAAGLGERVGLGVAEVDPHGGHAKGGQQRGGGERRDPAQADHAACPGGPAVAGVGLLA